MLNAYYKNLEENLDSAEEKSSENNDSESNFDENSNSPLDKRMTYRYGKRMTYRYGKRSYAMPYRFGKRSYSQVQKFIDDLNNEDLLNLLKIHSDEINKPKRMVYRYGRSVDGQKN